ncbi:acetyl-CoA C-acetyltransferase [Marinilactibacillus psychrotolerans]|uniref:acetyl-CoA C-acetyltransferase n=1 Tax=Marinilactibacillus psychrotolerans TaxID=191770 RepID=A0A5R9C0I1_9LACT|nr:acetyl-CoA C-acetyltransferase [Marinilactibacillus psychrotolerans]TLQ06169.1 acetyl-CoA C-acetyltransferase [Marinilactibacillus psychrotolerans]
MQKVYIAGAKRTPIGSFLGALKDVSAADLGKTAIQGVLNQSGVDPTDIDEVSLGNVLSAGQGQGVSRQASIKAGIPETTPAYGTNMVCGSGLKTVMNAFIGIRAGEYNVVVAGGTESMSQAPYLIPNRTRMGIKMGNFQTIDHMVHDGLTDAFEGYHMGVTAENIAEQYGISREDQDVFAFDSQKKSIEALDNGLFKEEVVSVEYTTRRKEQVIVDTDEYPNRKANLEKMSSLRPAFKKEGTVTAGNASGLNDGASATLIVGGDYLQEKSVQPLAEIVAIGQSGVNPSIMGIGPVPAIQQALKKSELSFEDIDVFELNEAFASQSLAVVHELSEMFKVNKESLKAKTNMSGGAISLGHPIGASGNRILVTLLYTLKRKGLKYGIASLCIGGGMGAAVIIRNTDID